MILPFFSKSNSTSSNGPLQSKHFPVCFFSFPSLVLDTRIPCSLIREWKYMHWLLDSVLFYGFSISSTVWTFFLLSWENYTAVGALWWTSSNLWDFWDVGSDSLDAFRRPWHINGATLGVVFKDYLRSDAIHLSINSICHSVDFIPLLWQPLQHHWHQVTWTKILYENMPSGHPIRSLWS